MKLAMLAVNSKLYTHQRLKEAAEARGHSLDIINTLRCYMNIASRRPDVYYEGEKLPAYDAIIPRIGASVTFYGMAVLRQFEMQGVFPLNESVAIGRSRQAQVHAAFGTRRCRLAGDHLRQRPQADRTGA